ncbi:MAG: zinc-binding dehydrogenase [Pseudonocardiaceae bacterium]
MLITAAAGGVGHLGVQLARVLGAQRVLAVVGSSGKQAFLRKLGVDAVISYAGTAPAWHETVNIVLDGIGQAALHRGIAALAPFSRLVSYSTRGGTVQINDLRSQARSIIGFTVAHWRDTHHSATPNIGNNSGGWPSTARYVPQSTPSCRQSTPSSLTGFSSPAKLRQSRPAAVNQRTCRVLLGDRYRARVFRNWGALVVFLASLLRVLRVRVLLLGVGPVVAVTCLSVRGAAAGPVGKWLCG